jgi:F-type H+-transporting ATPase subunit delta
MSYTKITIRYAQALFDLALEQGILEKVFPDMTLIDKVCHENKELTAMLHSPIINVDKKQRILKAVFADSIQALSLRFLQILAKKRREQHIDGIASAFTDLYKEYKGIKTAFVASVTELGPEEKKQVTGILKKITDKKIELVESLKKELIGGFVITMDNYQIDQSLSTKIKELKKEFGKNPYIKEF